MNSLALSISPKCRSIAGGYDARRCINVLQATIRDSVTGELPRKKSLLYESEEAGGRLRGPQITP